MTLALLDRPTVEAPPVELTALAGLVVEPWALVARHGWEPFGWQRDLARTFGLPRRGGPGRRGIVVAARQTGKGVGVSGALAARMILDPGVTIGVVSRTERQARLVISYVRRFLAVGLVDAEDVDGEGLGGVRLANGSSIVALPATADSLRGYAFDVLLLDECAYIGAEAVEAVLPSIAATEGDLVVVSTPRGPSGYFHGLWSVTETDPRWVRVRLSAVESPLISEAVIAEARGRLSPTAFARDFGAEFTVAEGAAFSAAAIEAMFADFTDDEDPFADEDEDREADW